jgi:hypothetical protein
MFTPKLMPPNCFTAYMMLYTTVMVSGENLITTNLFLYFASCCVHLSLVLEPSTQKT